MARWRIIVTKASLVVLGLTPILNAQECVDPPGPVWCPPLNCYLTPTLLDWLFGPGITSR